MSVLANQNNLHISEEFPMRTTASLPHGIVLPPPEVIAAVAEAEARFKRERQLDLDDATRKRMLEDLTIQHYFENLYIAYRPTDQGPEILAVGEFEVGHLLQSWSEQDLRSLRILIV